MSLSLLDGLVLSPDHRMLIGACRRHEGDWVVTTGGNARKRTSLMVNAIPSEQV